VQGLLYAAAIKRRGRTRRARQAGVPVGERQHRVAMGLPEAAQEIERRLRQRNEAILVALGVADMHARVRGVDIAQLQAQTFAQAQAEAIEGEEENAVADHACGGE